MLWVDWLVVGRSVMQMYCGRMTVQSMDVQNGFFYFGFV